MKKAIYLLFLLLLSLSSTAQNYLELCDSTKRWNTLYYGSWSWNIIHCAGTRTNQIGPGVLFNNTLFYQLFESEDSLSTNWEQRGFITEDTETGKVYYSSGDPQEIGLIYDFSLEPGDSITINNYYLGVENIQLICDSVDFVINESVIRKQLFLYSADNQNFYDIWIEGIGSKFGLLNSGFNGALMAGGGCELLCCSEDMVNIFTHPVYQSCYMEDFYPQILNDTFDTAWLNTPYTFQLQLADTVNVSYQLIGDQIPEGFEFNETTGLLTGFPEQTGSFFCAITVKNNTYGFLTDIILGDIQVMLPTKLAELTEETVIHTYPNPVENQLHISIENKNADFVVVEVITEEAKLIVKSMVYGSSSLDFSPFADGVYYLKVYEKFGRLLEVKKLIKFNMDVN